MKKVIVSSIVCAIFLTIFMEIIAFLKNWRPDFFSFSELVNILGGSIFYFLLILGGQLAVLKMIKEKETITLRVTLILVVLSILTTSFFVYIDDGGKLKNFVSISGIIASIVVSFIFFVAFSFSFLAFKSKL